MKSGLAPIFTAIFLSSRPLVWLSRWRTVINRLRPCFPLGVEVGDGLVERFDLTLFDELADGEADDRLGGRHRVNRDLAFCRNPSRRPSDRP